MKFLLICFFLLWIGLPTWAAETAPADIFTVPSPVVGVPLDHVRVWALHQGEWHSIPFQFDRHTPDGDWDFALHASPEAAHRRLTALDELVVAMADLGDAAPPATVPPGAPHPVSVGVAGRGRVYIATHDAPPPLSPRRWITYDRQDHQVVHPGVRLGFDPERPFVLDRLVWTADPNQADWLDTGKIRVTGRLMGTLAFRRTQEDFTSRITGVIAGPVRAIVRTEDRLRMILGIKSPRAIIDRIDTPYTLVMEVRMQLPFTVGWLFRDLAVRASLDLQPGESLTFTCPGHPTARIDGRTEPGETALCGSPMHGFTIAGPYGVVHGDLTFGPGVDLTSALYYADDVAQADPPEGRPGHYGESGVTLTGWERLGRGEYLTRLTLDLRPTSVPEQP